MEFESKKGLLSLVMNAFKDNEAQPLKRSVGKIYKNIDGNIYRIKSKKCPFCKTAPIGNMNLIRNIANREYIWVCSEQPSHLIPFDYKENF